MGAERTQGSFGFTPIELVIVTAIVAVVAAIAVPNLIEARKSGNEASAAGALKTIAAAQTDYNNVDPDQDGVNQFADDLLTLASEGLVDEVLGRGTQSGYRFDVEVSSRTSTSEWECSAKPEKKGKTGARSFFVDETGVIRFSDLGKAGENDPIFPEVGPTPTPGTVPRLPALLEQAAIKVIRKLDDLLPGDAITAAQDVLRDGSNVDAILLELDRNGDGRISWSEILGTNLLARARNVAPLLTGLPPPGGTDGPDEKLDKSAGAYQKKADKLANFRQSELPLPDVPTSAIVGDPVSLLEAAK